MAEVPKIDVWWARRRDLERLEPACPLNAAEAQRALRYRDPRDRTRFALGTVLTRLVAGLIIGCAPHDVPLTRTCSHCGREHGAPRIRWLRPLVSVSISHAGELVGVAASTHVCVGLDVEPVRGRTPEARELLRLPDVFSPAERNALGGHEATGAGVFRAWTRKEAVAKATQWGLPDHPSAVGVTAQGTPVCTGWQGHEGIERELALFDSTPAAGHVATVAAYGAHAAGRSRPRVLERDALDLLA